MIVTKEELKAKLTSDPEARKKFISATSEYYKSIGLTATQDDIAKLSDHLEKGSKPGVRPFPIIIIIIFPEPPIRGRE
jgi:hypothetical protein